MRGFKGRVHEGAVLGPLLLVKQVSFNRAL